MLRLLSVKYVSDDATFLRDNLSPDFQFIEGNGNQALYLNKRFLPRVRFVTSLRKIADATEARQTIYSPEFDPESVALLGNSDDANLDNGEILESYFENDYLHIRAYTGEKAFLVFSDSWHPGWRVYVDQTQFPLAKPYGFQMGVYIRGSGEHIIEFRFKPTGYAVGMWVSLITSAVMAPLLIYQHRRLLHSSEL
jgi:hypothetical protein